MAESTRDVGVQVRPRVSFRAVATVKQPGGAGGHTISHTPITGSPAVGISPIVPLSPPVAPSDISLAVSAPSAARLRLTTSVKHEASVPSVGEVGRSPGQGRHGPVLQRADISHGAEPEFTPAGLVNNGKSRAAPSPSPTRVDFPASAASTARVTARAHVEATPAPAAPTSRAASHAHVEAIPAPTASVARVISRGHVDARSTRVASPARVEAPSARTDSPAHTAVSTARVTSPPRVISPTPVDHAPLARVLSPDSFVERPRGVARRYADTDAYTDTDTDTDADTDAYTDADTGVASSSDDETQYWSAVPDPFAHEDGDENTDQNNDAATEATTPAAPAAAPSPTVITNNVNASRSGQSNGGRGYHYSFFGGKFVLRAPDIFILTSDSKKKKS